jgi:hypothetical protein
MKGSDTAARCRRELLVAFGAFGAMRGHSLILFR